MNVKADTHRRMVQKASVHQGGIKRHASPIAIVGRIASVLSVCMYVSYLPQIMDNLAGHPGNLGHLRALQEGAGLADRGGQRAGNLPRGRRVLDCRLLTPPRCPPVRRKVLARMANVSGRCVARKQVKQA